MRCYSHVFDNDKLLTSLRRLGGFLPCLKANGQRHLLVKTGMVALVLATIVLASGPTHAQDGKTIELYSGLMEVDIPSEFEELRLTEMELTFPSLPLPDYVYSDRLRTTLLAVSIVNNPDPNLDMLTYTAGWAKALEGTLPEFQWDQRRVARIEGRPWIVWQYNARTINQFKEPEASATIMFMSILSKDVMVLVLGHAPRGVFAQNMDVFQSAVTSLNLSIQAPQMSDLEAATQ